MRSLHVGRDDKMRSLHALRLVEMTRGGRDDKWPSVISSGVEKSIEISPCATLSRDDRGGDSKYLKL